MDLIAFQTLGLGSESIILKVIKKPKKDTQKNPLSKGINVTYAIWNN